MNKTLGIVLVLLGAAMVVSGIYNADPLTTELARAIPENPGGKSLWLLFGGITAALSGLCLTVWHALHL